MLSFHWMGHVHISSHAIRSHKGLYKGKGEGKWQIVGTTHVKPTLSQFKKKKEVAHLPLRGSSVNPDCQQPMSEHTDTNLERYNYVLKEQCWPFGQPGSKI